MFDRSDFSRLFSDFVADMLRSNLAFSFSTLAISSWRIIACCCSLLFSSLMFETSFSIRFTDKALSHIFVFRWLFLLSSFCTWLWRSALCFLIMANSFLTRTLLHFVSASSFCILWRTRISEPTMELSSDEIWSEEMLTSRSVIETRELLVWTSILESWSSDSTFSAPSAL